MPIGECWGPLRLLSASPSLHASAMWSARTSDCLLVLQQPNQNRLHLHEHCVDDALPELVRSSTCISDGAIARKPRIVAAPWKAHATVEDQGQHRLLIRKLYSGLKAFLVHQMRRQHQHHGCFGNSAMHIPFRDARVAS